MAIPSEWDLTGRKAVITADGRGWTPYLAGALAEAGAEADSDRGVSGKTILLATAIASAALVTAAWLLRSRCEPMDSAVWVRFPNWPAERYGTSRDGTRYRVPPPPPPPYPLPALCGPTR